MKYKQLQTSDDFFDVQILAKTNNWKTDDCIKTYLNNTWKKNKQKTNKNITLKKIRHTKIWEVNSK